MGSWKSPVYIFSVLASSAHSTTKVIRAQLPGFLFALRGAAAGSCLRWRNGASGEQRGPAYL